MEICVARTEIAARDGQIPALLFPSPLRKQPGNSVAEKEEFCATTLRKKRVIFAPSGRKLESLRLDFGNLKKPSANGGGILGGRAGGNGRN
jgi:hypothetical protein